LSGGAFVVKRQEREVKEFAGDRLASRDCGRRRQNYLPWNARRASPGIMLDGEAMAAPAPKNAAPVASSEKAIDMTDRFTSTRPVTAGDSI
jgi:hypothetical protein